MLIYSPVFDIYHCCYRAIRILRKTPSVELEIERWRILDFYLLFPVLMTDFRFPTEYKEFRRLIPSKQGKYRNVGDPKRIFFRMEPFQSAALNFLASHGVILSRDLIDRRKIKWNEAACPPQLKNLVDNEADDPVIQLLTGPFMSIDLFGKSGLKARSDLFQYRYDVPGAAKA